MDLGLRGIHIFLTGASGGIGLVTAKMLVNEGARVTLQYHSNLKALESLKQTHKAQVNLVKADVRSEHEIKESIKKAITSFGPIHGLIVNHGIWVNEAVPIVDMELTQWEETIQVDLTGSFLYVREFLREYRKNPSFPARIVLVGSTAGKFGEAMHADYATAKAGLMYGFTLSLKNELVKLHPHASVNVVAPGWVLTPMAEEALTDKALYQKILQTIAMNKVAKPEEVAKAIISLISPSLYTHTTGMIFDVNGGMEGRILHE